MEIWEYKNGEIVVVVPEDYETYVKMLKNDVLVANTHVFLGSVNNYLRTLGKFHESKDVLEGTIPYGGDILNKKWSCGEEYSYHLLIFHQVENYFLNYHQSCFTSKLFYIKFCLESTLFAIHIYYISIKAGFLNLFLIYVMYYPCYCKLNVSKESKL